MAEQLDVVERVIQILQQGAYNSTYKLASLVGLLDLCVENTSDLGWPPTTITTRQLAEKVVELYWSQVRPWEGQTLRQNNGRQGVILGAVAALRDQATAHISAGAGVARVRRALPGAFNDAVEKVEWKLIQMPLPKLQRVGGQDTGWLYRIGWDDHEGPSEAQVRAYQRGKPSDFDNRISLRPEVAMAFVRLHGLLRPFIEQKWAAEVAKINGLPEDRLGGFLFGVDRSTLRPIRKSLHELQEGSCFYCRGKMHIQESHVDHFIPWARHADDGLDNLVLAHTDCNNDKSDYLAGAIHVERWRERRETQRAALTEIASTVPWDTGGNRTLGAARALYLRLPPEVRLWCQKGGAFEVADQRRLQRLLADPPPAPPVSSATTGP